MFTSMNLYSTFTLSGFNDQERNLTIVKTDFKVIKLKFHACNFNRFSNLFINYMSRDLDNTKIYFYVSFSFGTWLSNLHV